MFTLVRCTPTIAATLWLSAAPVALGQSGDDPASPIQEAGESAPDRQTSFSVEGIGAYHGAADVEGSAGDVSVFRAGAILGFRHAASDRLTVFGDFAQEWSDYDFENAAGLFAGASDAESPFDSLHESVLSLGFSYAIDDSWSVFGRGIVGAGYESGADFGDSIYAGGFAGFGYRFSDQLSLSFGAGALSRLEDDALVIPIVGVQWQINDDWRLETEGLGARLGWTVCDQFELHGFARYSSRDYRIDEANAYLPGGAFIDNRVLVGAGADWRPAEGITLTLEAGASVWQEFRFFNSAGDEISDRETDPQLMIRAGFEILF
jgi:hypothetical protein